MERCKIINQEETIKFWEDTNHVNSILFKEKAGRMPREKAFILVEYKHLYKK